MPGHLHIEATQRTAPPHFAESISVCSSVANLASRLGPRFPQASTPYIANLKPSGKYVMEDLHTVGGTPAVLKYMLKEGYLHGDCLTVTGKTIAENIADLPDLTPGQDVIYSFDVRAQKTWPRAVWKHRTG